MIRALHINLYCSLRITTEGEKKINCTVGFNHLIESHCSTVKSVWCYISRDSVRLILDSELGVSNPIGHTTN